MKLIKYIWILLLLVPLMGVAQDNKNFSPDADSGYNGGMGEFDPMGLGKPKPKRRGYRVALNKFTLGISGGYAKTLFRQDIRSGGTTMLDYKAEEITLPEGTAPTPSVKYIKAYDHTVPLNVSLQFELMNLVKIGGGAYFDYHIAPSVTYDYELADDITTPKLMPDATFIRRYYGLIGLNIYAWGRYSYWLEYQMGKTIYGPEFALANMSSALYHNIGITSQYKISEYFKIYLRPAWEFNKYDMSGAGGIVTTKMNAAYLSFGVFMNYPDVPMCPIETCHVVQQHMHEGYEFRGVRIWRKQNLQVGENNKKAYRAKRQAESKKQRNSGL